VYIIHTYTGPLSMQLALSNVEYQSSSKKINLFCLINVDVHLHNIRKSNCIHTARTKHVFKKR